MAIELDTSGICISEDGSLQYACPADDSKDVSAVLLANKITEDLKKLGISDGEIKRLLTNKTVVKEFGQLYRAAMYGGKAKIDVQWVNDKPVLTLNIETTVNICNPGNSDSAIHECTSKPWNAFNDSFSIPDEGKTPQKPARPRSISKHENSPSTSDSYSLIDNDTLAIAEEMNEQKFKKSLAHFSEMVLHTKGGCSSGHCKDNPTCYVNDDVQGEPRWDLIRSGICFLCGWKNEQKEDD